MAVTSPTDTVCLHCGGPVELRHGDFGDLIHRRQKPRVTPVCPRSPIPVTRAEYEAQKTANASNQ